MATKTRGDRRRMLGVVLLGCIGISSGAAENGESQFLRRKRLDAANLPEIGTSANQAPRSTVGKMEDLWDQAAAAASLQLDAERLLQMSMPTRQPTPAPIQPTRDPASPTGPPVDCLNGRTREEYIFDLLSEITPANVLNDPSTPQGMAFNYLASDDPNLEDPCSSTTIEQRYGLTTLYYSTLGANWLSNEGWLGEDQECQWHGVVCENTPGILSRLLLPDNNLVGSLIDELLTLDQLERLDLFSNAVTGTLPEGVASMTDLILLDLENNVMTGVPFPDHLLTMTSLVAYRTSGNLLEGSIPRQIENLSNLEQLWVATNRISGTIPTELASPPYLQSLFLYENFLVGGLPTELGGITGLRDFRIYANTLQEKLPTEFGALTDLEALRLEVNFFTGSIPTEIGELTNLRDIRIDTNSLSGTLPTEIGFLTDLEIITANNNFLAGPIPNSFDDFEHLDFFDVANNLLTGSIPETIFSIPTLRLVYLSNNTLSGTVPEAYSTPPLLRDLYLDGNGLTGTIPAVPAGRFEVLSELLFQFNFLEGEMPASICNLRDAGTMEDLFADCGGREPEIECDYPECCNRCFEGGTLTRRLQGRVAT